MNLLTTRELADYLGLSPATVLRRWRAGELPGYRLASNVLRFDQADIDEWLAERAGRGRRYHPSYRNRGPSRSIGDTTRPN
jgi:excisionase family DNA binding protein